MLSGFHSDPKSLIYRQEISVFFNKINNCLSRNVAHQNNTQVMITIKFKLIAHHPLFRIYKEAQVFFS